MRQRTRIFRNCEVCGHEFYTYMFRINEGKGRFCSKVCQYSTYKGKHRSPLSEFKKGQLPLRGMLGKQQSLEWRESRSLSIQGDKHPNWKGGIASESSKKWRINNITYVYYLNARRRAVKLNAEGNHSYKEWEELKEKFNFTCLACNRKEPEVTLTQDHIVPLSKGGDDWITNIQPLCKSCNSRKHVKVISYV